MNRSKQTVEHTIFNQIGNYLTPGDLIVLNNSKTINALLNGWLDGKRRVEVRLCSSQDAGNKTWQCTVKPARTPKVGAKITFENGDLNAAIVGRREDLPYLWTLEFDFNGDFFSTVNKVGRPIVSPYVS